MDHCRQRISTGLRLFHLLLSVTSLTTVAVGCVCSANSNRQLTGEKPPAISRPQEIAAHLRRSVNPEVRAFGRAAGFLYMPFKRFGISGWTYLGYDADVVGLVQQTAKSTDQFYTVDMKLETLEIDHLNIPLADERYLRAEICLCDAKLSADERPRVGDKVWMRGRMVWDGDGFVEIHPRAAAEVKRLNQ